MKKNGQKCLTAVEKKWRKIEKNGKNFGKKIRLLSYERARACAPVQGDAIRSEKKAIRSEKKGS